MKVLNNFTEAANREKFKGQGRVSATPLLGPIARSLEGIAVTEKNIEMLERIEDVAAALNALRVTFCKSGKDRTGMSATLEQSRYLSKKFFDSADPKMILDNANIMREYGTRLDVVEKNIHKRVYAINSLQVAFLPECYRPPTNCLENLVRTDGDNT